MLQFSSQCHVSNYVWKIPISHAQEELIGKGFTDETTNATKQTSFLTMQPVVLARFWFQTFPDNPMYCRWYFTATFCEIISG